MYIYRFRLIYVYGYMYMLRLGIRKRNENQDVQLFDKCVDIRSSLLLKNVTTRYRSSDELKSFELKVPLPLLTLKLQLLHLSLSTYTLYSNSYLQCLLFTSTALFTIPIATTDATSLIATAINNLIDYRNAASSIPTIATTFIATSSTSSVGSSNATSSIPSTAITFNISSPATSTSDLTTTATSITTALLLQRRFLEFELKAQLLLRTLLLLKLIHLSLQLILTTIPT